MRWLITTIAIAATIGAAIAQNNSISDRSIEAFRRCTEDGSAPSKSKPGTKICVRKPSNKNQKDDEIVVPGLDLR